MAAQVVGVNTVADKPLLVKAIHAYTPVNNDELKLEKGDVITVTQKEEGGWWEGTLYGRTGWFPSNYVTEDVSPTSSASSVDSFGHKTSSWSSPTNSGIVPKNSLTIPDSLSSPAKGSTLPLEEQTKYRMIILSDLLESEETHVRELSSIWENYLQHLSKSAILTPAETKILIGNLPEIIQCHISSILTPIKTEQGKSLKEQRIGKVFLDNAPKLESTHKTYCENHPKAVQVIEKYKEALGSFMEAKGSKTPGLLTLLNSLSQPFLHLEKYPTSLQELERHVEESHKDRGDLQRSIEYYKQIDKNCGAIRKQKEMELEVLSGAIAGWEGSDVSQLGDILHMNLVHIGQDSQPRYFVLFTNTLLILSYNSERNSLAYEGKIPVSGITLTPVTEKERNVSNAFEIAGPMLDPILVSCASKAAKDSWVYHLSKILRTNRFPSFGSSPLQVVPSSFLNSSQDNLVQASSCRTYTPAKTSPYVILVEHFAKLNKIKKLFPDPLSIFNTPIEPAQPIQHQQEPVPTLEKLYKQPFLFKISSDSAQTASGSSFSNSFDSTKKPNHLQPLLQPESALEKVSLKWRWGISNFLSVRNSRSPCYFPGSNQWNSLPALQTQQGQCDNPSTFLIKSQSVPLMKPYVVEDFGGSAEAQEQRLYKRGRLTRQDAFDFDDGDEIFDENENFEQINFNEARAYREEDRQSVYRSFDSGLGLVGRPISDEQVSNVARVYVQEIFKLETDSVGHLSPPVQAWNISRLRPTAPYNPFLNECLALAPASTTTTSAANNGNGTNIKTNATPNTSTKLANGKTTGTTFSNYTTTTPQVTNEEDFAILSIVDAFCSKNRQVSVPGQEVGKTNTGAIGDNAAPSRTLADLVFCLRDEVSVLKSSMARVTNELDEEQRARKALQTLFQTYLASNHSSVVGSSGTSSVAE